MTRRSGAFLTSSFAVRGLSSYATQAVQTKADECRSRTQLHTCAEAVGIAFVSVKAVARTCDVKSPFLAAASVVSAQSALATQAVW